MNALKFIRILLLLLFFVSIINLGSAVIILAAEPTACGWCLGTVNPILYPQCETGGCCCIGCVSCWGFCWECGCSYPGWQWSDQCPGD